MVEIAVYACDDHKPMESQNNMSLAAADQTKSYLTVYPIKTTSKTPVTMATDMFTTPDDVQLPPKPQVNVGKQKTTGGSRRCRDQESATASHSKGEQLSISINAINNGRFLAGCHK